MMMKHKSETISLIAALLILIPALTFSAEVSISVSPIRMEHLVKQGERGTDVISVTNSGTAPTRLKVSIEDWSLTKDGNPIFTKVENGPHSCAAWIRINPVDFRIGPGQIKDVRYTVTVPQGIDEGGYRAAVIFETIPDPVPGEKVKRVLLKGRIITIVYEIVGNPIPQGHANGLRAEMKEGGIDFILGLQNTGRVHYRTKGSINVKTSSGDKVFEVELPDVPVLPGSEREVKVHYDKPISRGTYTALAILDIGKKELIGSETTFSVE